MAKIEVKESGLTEDEVMSIVGDGVVQVTEAVLETGQFGEQIRMTIQHKETGLEFPAWSNPTRKALQEVALCLGLAAPDNDFETDDLKGKSGRVRIMAKTDKKGIARAKIDKWLPPKRVAAPAKAAPVATKSLDEEGLPF
jgi:hypothetical protein